MAQQPIPTAITSSVQPWMTSAPPIPTTQSSYFSQITGGLTPAVATQQRDLSAINSAYTAPVQIESYAVPDFLNPGLDPERENECNLSIAIEQCCFPPKDQDEEYSNNALTHNFIPRLQQICLDKGNRSPRWNQQLITWINQHDVYGNTPLMYAAHYGVLPVIKPLVVAGATPLKEPGKTSLHAALSPKKRHKDVTPFQVLSAILSTLPPQSRGDVINMHFVDVAKDNEGKIIPDAILLQKKGNTILHDVLEYQYISPQDTQQLVRLLLHFGANPLLKNGDNETAIDLACSFEYTEKTTILEDLLNAVPTADMNQIIIVPQMHTAAQIETIQNAKDNRATLPLTGFEHMPFYSRDSAAAPMTSPTFPVLSSAVPYSTRQTVLQPLVSYDACLFNHPAYR